MSPGSRGPVVVDTGVFAARLTPSGSLLAARYRPVLEGRPAVISFVTVAELGYGARLAGWGPGRLRRLEYEIARAEIVWPGPNLVDAYASLRTWCSAPAPTCPPEDSNRKRRQPQAKGWAPGGF